MRINYNVTAMLTNNALHRNDSNLSKAMERLSSGYKINSAKDNPSGLALSRRMNAQIRGLDVAGDNTTNGISVIEVCDGALGEIHDILQRMNELAIKGANGVLADSDRVMIDDEFQALKEEVQRIADTTQFNGQNLLDGSFDMKGYTTDGNVKVNYYDEKVPVGKYTLTLTADWEDGKLTDKTADKGQNNFKLEAPNGDDITNNVTISAKEDVVIITGSQNFKMQITLVENTANIQDMTIDITGMGSLTLQIGANEGQTLDVKIPAMTTKNMSIHKTDTLTMENSTQAINDVDYAIRFVSSARSALGAYQNRLEHTANSLDVTSENMTTAYSRVMDTDMATEMTEYSSYQVINQAATSMLAQANERPSTVLQLLQ